MTTTDRPNGSSFQRKQKAERPMVPKAEFGSYYGSPVLNPPVWESPDIPGYLFLGGLAGGSSLLGAGASLTGRPALAAVTKSGAIAGAALSMYFLVHDLGRPARFLNMLRVFKVTSPMSVGSWLLAAYVPAAGVAAATDLWGMAGLRDLPGRRLLGAASTAGAAVLGPFVASYTAALISDTAVPSWHDGYPEMPFIFTGSGAMAAGGLGLLGTSVLGASAGEAVPARNLALLGAAMESAAMRRMTRRLTLTAEPFATGRAGKYVKAAKILAGLGAAGTVASAFPLPVRARRAVAAVSGVALVAGSACTRWGIFHAGVASAEDPKYTVIPQRERLESEAAGHAGSKG
ncbi:MAG: polysulfide reductase NrfD [Streptosporangiales bacterium]|nr:polysulfide reductase NrfD [Streptosporangiales bacterium]